MPTWKPIKGFEKRYEVSSTGKIRNRETGLVRKYRKDRDGYAITDLKMPGVHKTVKVHRVVASHFAPAGTKDQVLVNHKNGDKGDYSVKNLEWASHSENTKHAYDTGLRSTGLITVNSHSRKGRVVKAHKRKKKKSLGGYRGVAGLSNTIEVVRKNVRISLKPITDQAKENKFRQKAGGMKTPIRKLDGSLYRNRSKKPGQSAINP
jgi:hypothetical protein